MCVLYCRRGPPLFVLYCMNEDRSISPWLILCIYPPLIDFRLYHGSFVCYTNAVRTKSYSCREKLVTSATGSYINLAFEWELISIKCRVGRWCSQTALVKLMRHCRSPRPPPFSSYSLLDDVHKQCSYTYRRLSYYASAVQIATTKGPRLDNAVQYIVCSTI